MRLPLFITEQRGFNEDTRERTSNILARMDRMEGDSGTLKGYLARDETVADASGIAEDMGLEFIRTLTGDELRNMCGGRLDGSVSQSFRRAGLVIEATDGSQIHGNGDFVHGQPARLHRSDAKRRTADPVHRQTGRASHRQREERSRSPGTRGLRKSPPAPAGGQNARPGVKLGRSGQHEARLQVIGNLRSRPEFRSCARAPSNPS